MAGINEPRPIWYSFKEGKIMSKRGNEVLEFNAIQGTLTALRVVDEEYQGERYKKLQIHLHDGKELSILQMKLTSGYGRAFSCIVPNLNLSLPLLISGGCREVNGKKRTTMYIRQNSIYVKWYYTRETPHDLPPVEEIKDRWGTNYDFSKQEAFFEKMIVEMNHNFNSSAKPVTAGPALDFDGIKDDGLPF